MLSALRSRGLSAAARRLQSTSTLTVDNPYTGETYCEVGQSTEKEALGIVSKAAAAQSEFRGSSLDERVALCDRFMVAMESMREQIATDISGMMGKPYLQAFGEVGGVYERTKGMMELAPAALAEEVLAERNGCSRIITREPVGTVLVVAPWNFPLLTAVNTIVPAVLAGNSVIIKQSSRTPLCAEHFQQAFEAAGAPPGLVQAMHCSHEVVDTVISDRSINFVAFTGSVRGGHEVYRSIAKSRFIDCTLELGGKDPAYVAADMDPVEAAEGLVDGAMYNAGQSCCGIERIYVHRSKYDAFLEAAKVICDGYVLGDPMAASTTTGPQAQAGAVPFLSGQVQDALSKGARLLSGSPEGVHDSAGRGRFFAPTLLADCDHSMEVMMEESFGPVLPVMPVDSDEEAVALMSDSRYGLTAAIFTHDPERVRKMGAQIPTGTVFMNRCDYLDPELPWTAGGEDTGKGVSLSRHGFNGVTKLKGYNMKM